MFTGLIEEVGTVKTVQPRGDGATLTIGADTILDGTVRIGDSISINGACQTVVQLENRQFTVEVVRETLRRTRLGEMKSGERVNLERAMRPSDRLGGHLVQGHVDQMIALQKIEPLQGSYRIRLELPKEGSAFVVEKGSICLDGISLTVAAKGADWFEVEIIPHTWEHTTMIDRRSGDRIHVEWDLIAKYVQNMLGPHIPDSGLTMDKLRELGF